MSKQRLQQNCVIALAVLMSWAAAAEPPEPIPVKVVVVTMFEVGADEGDRAGEFQLWQGDELSKRPISGQDSAPRYSFPNDQYMECNSKNHPRADCPVYQESP